MLTGEFRAFNSRARRSPRVLASAAIPTIFRAVHLDGGTYWDGLFSQNPPVRELVDTAPDEIWVIQINAPERETEPTTVVEIADRRNELAGNLSLHQELHFIEKIDELLEEGVHRARRALQADHGARHRAVALATVGVARPCVQAQPRPRVHRRAHRARRGAGGGVPRRALLRARVARGVTWTVRVDGERSRAHAELRDGRITRFVVG